MRKKVLLVEDSIAFAGIVQKSIQDINGFPVDIKATLAETEQALQQSAEDYFVAIVDYHLPDANNGEAIDTVKQHNLPVVVFTASKDRGLKEDLWSKGITDYAHKQGTYNLDYVVWLVKRIYNNYATSILVVKDSRVARKKMESMLRTQRFNVFIAESGPQAIEILQMYPEISLAIIDCHMEGMNSFELITRIRERRSSNSLEIIGVSDQDGHRLSAEFMKAGANDFIIKPYLPEEFLCRVNKSIDRIEGFSELKSLNSLKNQFLSTAAHDIRGPLGAIKTAADFLKKGASEERRNKLYDLISSNSSDLIELLESLLDVSIIESGALVLNKEPTDLSQLVSERIELYQAEVINKKLSCNTEIAPNITSNVDATKIRQVVDNLLTNAIKYSIADNAIKIELSAIENKCIFKIQDAGPGVDIDEQDKLFEPFSNISTKTTGGERKIGLGLAIAKQIIEAHNGNIFYRHDETWHSTFIVEIPVETNY